METDVFCRSCIHCKKDRLIFGKAFCELNFHCYNMIYSQFCIMREEKKRGRIEKILQL